MSMTREEIEQKMGELVNKYRETHDKGLIEDIYELAYELENMKMLEKAVNCPDPSFSQTFKH